MSAGMVTRCLALALLLAAPSMAGAIVIRDDVDDARYRIPASALPALADLPGEGHGVLIAPRWVLTAAHAIAWQSALGEVSIAGVPRRMLPDSSVSSKAATVSSARRTMRRA